MNKIMVDKMNVNTGEVPLNSGREFLNPFPDQDDKEIIVRAKNNQA